MEARAVARYVRISPQKVRLVVDLIRGKKVEEADRVLAWCGKS
jgi:large subunit ribosomal protein L22